MSEEKKKRIQLSVERLNAALIPGQTVTIQGSFYFENKEDSIKFFENFPYNPINFKYGLYFEEKTHWLIECSNDDCVSGIETLFEEPTNKECALCGCPLDIEKVG